jgi:hypothetical protein
MRVGLPVVTSHVGRLSAEHPTRIRCHVDDLAEEAATIVRSKAQAMLVRGATSNRATQDDVFAVFALGTAFQLNHPAKADNPWLKMARDLLSAWRCDLSGADHLYRSHLSQAFTYYDSLSILMKDESVPESVKRRQGRLQFRLHETLNPPVTVLTNIVPASLLFTPMGPSSWCGASCEIWNAESNKAGTQDFVWQDDMPDSRWHQGYTENKWFLRGFPKVTLFELRGDTERCKAAGPYLHNTVQYELLFIAIYSCISLQNNSSIDSTRRFMHTGQAV